MSVQFHSSPEQAQATWKALCAKAGVSAAANAHPKGVLGCGNKSELHEVRKTTRQAINKITDDLRPNDYTNEVTDGLMWGGEIVKAANAAFERMDDAERFFGNQPKASNVLRNSADFDRHYASRSQSSNEAPFDLADYLRGVANLRASPGVQNALAIGTDTSGGYAVPGVLMPGILSAMVPASSLLRAGAGIIPLEEGAKTYTTVAVDSIPTAAWRAEAGALATSDPSFRAVVATPRSLSFSFKVSRELLADAVGIADALNRTIAQAFAKELDRVGLRGSGTAPQPRGIANTSGIQSVTNSTNGLSLDGFQNFMSAIQLLMAADAPSPTAAIMSPRSLVKLNGLKDTTGQPLNMPRILETLPMIQTSQIPDDLVVGTSTDCTEIYVSDFSKMYFAMRENVSIQMLNELYAGTGEIGFACHVRADVVLTYPAAFALITGVRA